MLRIEFRGQPYDWFNLDGEIGDVIRSGDFANTLRENVAHYFGVPFEYQAVFDEEGLLSTVVDFVRALQAVKPSLQVFDIREMAPKARERASAQLAIVLDEVKRAQQMFREPALPAACSGSAAMTQPAAPPLNACGSNGHTNVPAFSQAATEPLALSGIACRDSSSELLDKLAERGAATNGPSWPAAGGSLPYGNEAVMDAVRQAAALAQSQGFQPSNGLPGFTSDLARDFTQPAISVAQTSGLSGHRQVHVETMVEPIATPASTVSASAWANRLPTTGGGGGLELTERPNIADVPGGGGRQQCGPASQMAGMANFMSQPSSANSFEVVLSKGVMDRFGFANVPTPDSRGLVVSWIDEKGLLAAWNARNVDKAVREGDRVLIVNGVTEGVDSMRAKLQADTIRMRIQRGGPAMRQPFGP
jgi:hypothetical protein